MSTSDNKKSVSLKKSSHSYYNDDSEPSMKVYEIGPILTPQKSNLSLSSEVLEAEKEYISELDKIAQDFAETVLKDYLILEKLGESS